MTPHKKSALAIRPEGSALGVRTEEGAIKAMTEPLPPQLLHWTGADGAHSAQWLAESAPMPRQVKVADDQLTAAAALHLARQGKAILWRGDFYNARQLLQAMARRIDKLPPQVATSAAAEQSFSRHRDRQALRAQLLSCLLIPLDPGYRIALRRAPDVSLACSEAFGSLTGKAVMPLRQLQGLIGAHEWRRKGVDIPVLGARIHPHFGVFSPVRGEYLDLLASAPLPAGCALAFDIGTGTGVIAALLARRGVARVVATDNAPRALACARENIKALGLEQRIEVLAADLFPPGQAALVVCNPPWLPATPVAGIEHAVYDPDSRMLRSFLGGLDQHLAPGGEGWLILSDLAEHLGLRTRNELLACFAESGLQIIDRIDIRPRHPRATEQSDPLYAARSAEITSLWRLSPAAMATLPATSPPS